MSKIFLCYTLPTARMDTADTDEVPADIGVRIRCKGLGRRNRELFAQGVHNARDSL